MSEREPDPCEPDVARLAAKARRWHDSGMMTDSEYGAVCAVLYVGDVEAVTENDREWARMSLNGEVGPAQSGAELTVDPPTSPAAIAREHLPSPEPLEVLAAALRDTPDEYGTWDRRPSGEAILAVLAGRGYVLVRQPRADEKRRHDLL